ncbi:MAG: HAD family phosphatase [Steroidobacteraceae bacterium]
MIETKQRADIRDLGRARPVRAVLFDLDGTLIDTELQTDTAVSAVAAHYGVAGFSLPHTETRGRTWMHVADEMRARTGIDVPASDLAAAMLAHWTASTSDARTIPGAPEAIRAAAACQLKLAVVSSSPRSVIDYFLDRLGVSDCIGGNARIGSESVRATKPDPEGFLLAARALDVEPVDTLVFEDSRAGLLAARAAGMRAMFVTCCAAELTENSKLATAICTHYLTLPPRFWDALACGSADLGHRSFT